jgi:hypothetical protein
VGGQAALRLSSLSSNLCAFDKKNMFKHHGNARVVCKGVVMRLLTGSMLNVGISTQHGP